MRYFRAYAQFETTRPEQWTRIRITDTLTSMPYVPDERKAEKNSPTSDLFFKPKTGFRMYSNSFEPLMSISTENTPMGCSVKMRFELPKTVTVFLLFSVVFCVVFFLAMVIGGEPKYISIPLVYVPSVFVLSTTAFRITCRHVLKRVTESLEIYERVKLLSGADEQ